MTQEFSEGDVIGIAELMEEMRWKSGNRIYDDVNILSHALPDNLLLYHIAKYCYLNDLDITNFRAGKPMSLGMG